MKRKTILYTFLACCQLGYAGDVVWFDGQHPVTYQVEGQADPVVHVALQMFADDMQQVTGMKPVSTEGATIRIRQGQGHDDGFRLSVSNGKITIEGHNGRGTAYGLLELSRLAGVSPWVWWGDVVPERRSLLTIADSTDYEQTPAVQYRGIFINDEDWSLRHWASTTFEPSPTPDKLQSIGPKTYKEIFKLLLRLRANTIWPAMHEGGTGFFTVKGNKETADSCGILIGSSHCEPLLRNNVAEWDVRKRGPYNYITNREEVRRYWTERLQEVRGSEELFTIGMRGIHDGAMEGVKTPEEKLNGLQQVIDDQRELIRHYYNKEVERVPQVFIPYKEVLEIMENGLQVPDDVMLMWCDDNYGYLTRLPDSLQQKRSGGGGIYYHLSYWGRPHDHLWLTTTQPGLIYAEMKAAYDHNCRRLWIANVHDPKVAAYDLELFLDMAWNPTLPFLRKGSGVGQHLEMWLCTQFGVEAGHRLLPVMKEYYRQNGIRRPEFMGWTQVELDKRKYPGGKSHVGDIPLTRQEAADRLAAFESMKAEVEACRQLIRPELSDAYFAHIVYPVYACAAMTRKIVSDSAESHQAYEEIQLLTARYNALGNGKWRGLMDAAPRRLPVFDDVHATLAADSPKVATAPYIARNACDYQSSTPSLSCGETYPLLGHSMNAVAVHKGSTLVYHFKTPSLPKGQGEAFLYTAMIPTQPSDRGDLRYSVQIDDRQPVVISLKEPYRSEQWKQNVLRGQALKKTPIRLSEGEHTLKVKALDDHIIFDQWMIDFEKDRSFYVIQ